jgi:hypothetical protein
LILLGKCPIPKEIQQLPVFDLTMRSRIPFAETAVLLVSRLALIKLFGLISKH